VQDCSCLYDILSHSLSHCSKDLKEPTVWTVVVARMSGFNTHFTLSLTLAYARE